MLPTSEAILVLTPLAEKLIRRPYARVREARIVSKDDR